MSGQCAAFVPLSGAANKTRRLLQPSNICIACLEVGAYSHRLLGRTPNQEGTLYSGPTSSNRLIKTAPKTQWPGSLRYSKGTEALAPRCGYLPGLGLLCSLMRCDCGSPEVDVARAERR